MIVHFGATPPGKAEDELSEVELDADLGKAGGQNPLRPQPRGERVALAEDRTPIQRVVEIETDGRAGSAEPQDLADPRKGISEQQ